MFDCGLAEGISRLELSPFHYWGIADVADYDPIPWRSGRFDPAALATTIETRERAANVLHEWRDKGGGPTLAFCSSISHAEFITMSVGQSKERLPSSDDWSTKTMTLVFSWPRT